MEKSIINGPDTCEVYRFLRYNTEALYDPENDIVQEVPWNFTKFLIDGSTGQVVTFNVPRISPLQLRGDIEALLKKNGNEGPYQAPIIDFGGKTLTQEEKDSKSVCDIKKKNRDPIKEEDLMTAAALSNRV